MKILIIGGAGMVGQKLVAQLALEGRLGDQEISEVTLFDVVSAHPPVAPFEVNVISGDIADSATIDSLISSRPDVIFNLAAVV